MEYSPASATGEGSYFTVMNIDPPLLQQAGPHIRRVKRDGYGYRKLGRRGYTWGPPGPRVRAAAYARRPRVLFGPSPYSYGFFGIVLG